MLKWLGRSGPHMAMRHCRTRRWGSLAQSMDTASPVSVHRPEMRPVLMYSMRRCVHAQMLTCGRGQCQQEQALCAERPSGSAYTVTLIFSDLFKSFFSFEVARDVWSPSPRRAPNSG